MNVVIKYPSNRKYYWKQGRCYVKLKEIAALAIQGDLQIKEFLSNKDIKNETLKSALPQVTLDTDKLINLIKGETHDRV